ncbi:structural maintenance of chromosomes protein 2-like [Clytia hemisphaerica]|uniref:Uncharacterized protein n=1 Tax=Clytia hemisphaerica TaxID=252671 RepID=A0A7M5V372_9CNID
MADLKCFVNFIVEGFMNSPILLATILIISAIMYYKRHLQQTSEYYTHQIEQLKLQNQLLSLKNEYEKNQFTNERNWIQLRERNEKIEREIEDLLKCKEKYEKEREREGSVIIATESKISENDNIQESSHLSDKQELNTEKLQITETKNVRESKTDNDNHIQKLSKQKKDEVDEEIDKAKLRRHRFGELRRSLSSSSIPSEHDDEITTYPPIFEKPTDPINKSVYDYVNSLPAVQSSTTKIKQQKTTTTTTALSMNNKVVRHQNLLQVPEITITDTISFENYESVEKLREE